jgi:hypothetical protein
MNAATMVRPIDHTGSPDGDVHLLRFTDNRDQPGIVGVLMPGTHVIGMAKYDTEIYSLRGQFSALDEEGRECTVDSNSRMPLHFKKNSVMTLSVPEEGLNAQFPIVFYAFPMRK